MKLHSLILAVLVGTSSLAVAETTAPVSTSSGAVTTADTWSALTEPMPLSRGRDVIRLGGRAAARLRFQSLRGSTHIERVIVQFVDGSSQTVELLAKLDATNPVVELGLGDAPRAIDRLIVIGASSRRSAVQLFGL